jgi:hypothetical protein
MCDNVNSILLSQQSQSSPPPGVVVDARGLNVLDLDGTRIRGHRR